MTLLTTVLGGVLFLAICVVLVWEMSLKSAATRRKNARREAIVTRTLADMNERESAELRARIQGGADVLALLDHSKTEMPSGKVSV